MSDHRPTAEPPLIVTLALDAASQSRFDRLRRAHFPPERLVVGAHVTLFHQLPGDAAEQVAADLAAAAGPSATFEVAVAGPRSLGRGVAYDIRSPRLDELRAGLAERWAAWLTPQDRQPFRAHVTVQNKVAPEVARVALARLAAEPVPPAAEAVGVELWRYLGGPWERVGTFPFTGERAGS